MIIVRLELHSAVTGKVTELARMHVINDDTGNATLRNYDVRTLRGRSARALDKNIVQRRTQVKEWPSDAVHVWNLVSYALARMGYGKGRQPAPSDTPDEE